MSGKESPHVGAAPRFKTRVVTFPQNYNASWKALEKVERSHERAFSRTNSRTFRITHTKRQVFSKAVKCVGLGM